jgi:hypothetical protein
MNREKIAREFNITVRSLINKVEKKSRDDDEIANLDRLQKRITVAKQTFGDEVLIENAAPIIVQYAEPITANNDKFFTEMDMRAEFVKNMEMMSGKPAIIDENDEFIFDIVASVKKHYLKAKDVEKKEVFVEVNKLLLYSAQYLQLGDS